MINEAKFLTRLLPYLKKHGGVYISEIIVVDGGSTDDSINISEKLGATVLSSKPGRAIQMNCGVKSATGDLLYFVHADTLPPDSFAKDIISNYQNGYLIGCYRFKFDSPKWYLEINNYFTRFNKLWCRGGDQTLFIEKAFFEHLGGYNENMAIMEEYPLLEKAMSRTAFIVMPKSTLVSARKYDNNSYFRVMWANFLAFRKYKKGEDSVVIKSTYYSILN